MLPRVAVAPDIDFVVEGYHIDPGVGVEHTDFVVAEVAVGSDPLA